MRETPRWTGGMGKVPAALRARMGSTSNSTSERIDDSFTLASPQTIGNVFQRDSVPVYVPLRTWGPGTRYYQPRTNEISLVLAINLTTYGTRYPIRAANHRRRTECHNSQFTITLVTSVIDWEFQPVQNPERNQAHKGTHHMHHN
jgi:hypothetical protein